MNDLRENSAKLELQKKKVTWWKRPFVGAYSLIEMLWTKLDKPAVPDNTVMLHHREMMDILVFARTAQAIDSDKFSNQEFLMYVKIKYAFAKGMAEYQGLDESVKLLQVAIEAKNSYITLDQTEIRYRSSKQQELYEYVLEILQTQDDKTKFKEQVQEKLAEILPDIKTEEGRQAMQSYVEELEQLASHELGLKLLTLFKAYQLADYSILRTISDLVAKFKEQDVTDMKGLIALIISKYQMFEKLGRIIGITGQQNTPETYAKMIQYIALGYRHGLSYVKFDELLQVMRKWYRPFRAIVGIRAQYPPKDYKLPKEFCQEIPGTDIYEKYNRSLTDSKTGYAYVDFND